MTTEGVTADPVFLALTRPALRWGVPYVAMVVNGFVTIEAFLITGNLLALLIALPIHGVSWLLCLSEPRFFDLLVLWARTRGVALWGNHRYWRAQSYSPLLIDIADARGRRHVRRARAR
jgi:type IV secretion system protein VirB3